MCDPSETTLSSIRPNGVLPGYPNSDVLVSSEWVSLHLNDPGVRLIQSAWEPPTYYDAHLPGAHFVSATDISETRNGVPFMLLSQGHFGALMGRLGIDESTLVVAYDDSGGATAGRLWWALRYYGHARVRLLNGGLYTWRAEGRSIATEVPPLPAPRTFVGRPQPRMVADLEEVRRAGGDHSYVLVDTWLPQCYSGEWPCYDHYSRGGHIPGALNLYVDLSLDMDTMKVLPPERLAATWGSLGIRPEQRVIVYGTGGYPAAFAAAMLTLLGHADTAVYDGGMHEWCQHPELSLETGS